MLSKRNVKTGRFVKANVEDRLTKFSSFNRKAKSQCDDAKNIVTEECKDGKAERHTESDVINWFEGRRVIELSVLAEGLKKCTFCGLGPLFLHDIIYERRYGLGSILAIQCQLCKGTNNVPTGKTHRIGKRGPPIFDANSKIASAIWHSGLGEQQMNKLLTVIGIPAVHNSTIKIREREVGPVLETVAKLSCTKVLEREKDLSRNIDNPGQDGITASYDMGWQRRGSGKAYNSKSGHGALYGEKTTKILAYGTMISNCKICEVASIEDRKPRDHDCRMNWKGSAKSMESDLAVELVKSAESDTKVTKLVTDEDATTMARIKSTLSYPIKKGVDINHAKKNVANKLFPLKKKHKTLSYSVIQFLQKCFTYVIRANKGDCNAVRKGILNIVPHAFGEHENCGSWCGYHKDPDNYRHKSLPHGKDLKGEDLREDLMEVFRKYSENAEGLAHAGSTSINESFNNIVSSKATKAKHYSKSESFDCRIGAAVCQVNMGLNYITHVNKTAGLSPGKAHIMHAKRQENKAFKRRLTESSREFKIKRIAKKSKRNLHDCAKEVREGETYKNEVALEINEEEDEVIPPCIEPPLKVPASSYVEKIFVDVETTSTNFDAEIVQFSACSGDITFDKYILPNHNISFHASRVTKLTKKMGKLYYDGNVVQTVSLSEAIQEFLVWLKQFTNPLLIGHNLFSFDMRYILRDIEMAGRQNELVIAGFADTLPLFRQKIPDRQSYSQETLIKDMIGDSYGAHNALEDVISLQRLFNSVDVEDELLMHSVNLQYAYEYLNYVTLRHRNFVSLYRLIQENVVSRSMALKIAGSGLSYRHLCLSFERKGYDGLRSLLSEPKQHSVRVTKSDKVISGLYSYFEKKVVES